jgi:hypothetical protein
MNRVKLLEMLQGVLTNSGTKFGEWKPMGEKLSARAQKFLDELQPVLDRKDELQDEMKKLEAKAEYLNTEFGVDMRRMIGEPDSDAAHINMDHDKKLYRCSIDPPEKGSGVSGMVVTADENGHVKLVGDRPPGWVQEVLAEALEEAKKQGDNDDPKPTIQ